MMQIAAMFLRGFGWLRELASAFLRWLLSDFRHIAITALAVIAFGLWWQSSANAERAQKWYDTAGTWRRAALDWQTAHETLTGNVQRQTAAALAADLDHKERVDAQQRAIIERTDHDYQSRIASIRADAGRLRQQLDLAQAANSESGGSTAGVPGADDARCRAFGAADCDQFFERLPTLLAEADTNTAKLTGLQAYIRDLLAIDWQGEPTPETDSTQ